MPRSRRSRHQVAARLRNVEPAIPGKPGQHRVFERERGGLSAGGNVLHALASRVLQGLTGRDRPAPRMASEGSLWRRYFRTEEIGRREAVHSFRSTFMDRGVNTPELQRCHPQPDRGEPEPGDGIAQMVIGDAGRVDRQRRHTASEPDFTCADHQDRARCRVPVPSHRPRGHTSSWPVRGRCRV